MDSSNDYWVNNGSSPPKEVRNCDCKSDTLSELGVQPQDAGRSHLHSLSYKLEALILARFPRSEYWKLSFVSKRHLELVKSGELFKIRREIEFKEPSVFMLASGDSCWYSFDREFKSRRKLPILPSEFWFTYGDKETICAGTQLLVFGKEVNSLVIWIYELAMNKWHNGPSMINPRCLFASAACGTTVFVAGGIGMAPDGEVFDTAEKYNPEIGTWDPLPKMKRRRKLCSGCYMDDRFYVLGGRNDDGELTCGEYFDESTNEWVLMPDMFKDDPVRHTHSPPLLAVVNNELYSLEASSNRLKVYLKKSNTWKSLGSVPLRADSNRGWGIAFKSLGNELLAIGASATVSSGESMDIYTCCPHPEAEKLEWRPLHNERNQLHHFILNCSVMVA